MSATFKYHPGAAFVDTLKGTASAQFGLHVNMADIALSGRELFPYEYYGIYRRSQLYPIEIEAATGAFDARGKSNAIGVFVQRRRTGPDDAVKGTVAAKAPAETSSAAPDMETA